MIGKDSTYYDDGRNTKNQKSLVDTYSMDEAPRTDNSFAEWLYGDYDESKYHQFLALYSLPGIHQYFDYLLDARKSKEYMNRYDIDYPDIHDPRKLPSTASTTALYRATYNFVSDNVKRLYR